MSRIPFAFSLILLAFTAHAHDHDHTEHGSLGKHEHGVATLDLALEGGALEIALDSPAMNLVGFEHAPSSDADRRKIAQARERLEDAAGLFGLPAAANCKPDDVRLESPLFANGQAHAHEDGHAHSDIEAEYSFTCAAPGKLGNVDLSGFFERFPATGKLNVQAIGPNGQRGETLTAKQPTLRF